VHDLQLSLMTTGATVKFKSKFKFSADDGRCTPRTSCPPTAVV